MPGTQIMCFSTSNLISSCVVCLWPKNYQNSVATPRTITSRFTGREPTVRYWGNMSLFLSSILWQQSFFRVKLCSNSANVLFLFFFEPSMKLSTFPAGSSFSLRFYFLFQFFFFLHSFSILSISPFPLPNMLAVWFSEVTKGSVSLGLCEPVSGWCNYDGWSNF